MNGADISGYQGNLNWDTLGSLEFIISKATEGADFIDHSFAHNQAEGRRTGKLRGYYHFARPDKFGPQAEADFFVNVVGALQTGEIMALDWEQGYAGNHVAWCLPFLNRVEARTGVKPYIYMNMSYEQGSDWSLVINQGYPLWIAAPGKSSQPATQWPADHARLWQYSFSGLSGGDSDQFNGDANIFKYFGYQGHKPINEEVDDMLVPLVKVSDQGGLHVWTCAEGFYDITSWKGDCYLIIKNEGANPANVEVFSTPFGANWKGTIPGRDDPASRVPINMAAIGAPKGGFATTVKTNGVDVVPQLSVLATKQ